MTGKSPARDKQAEKARGGADEATLAGFAPRFIAEILSQQRRGDVELLVEDVKRIRVPRVRPS